ncbi:MAG TPA: hypothetical protein VF711_00440, partial [Acidimicrobiales bacterium]
MRFGGALPHYFDRRFDDMRSRVDQLEENLHATVAIDVETVSEISINMERLLERHTSDIREALTRPSGFDGRLPFAGVMSHLHPGARILHLGGSESGAASLLATLLTLMGFEVTVLPAAG